MKRDFDQALTDFDGKPFGDGATLKTVCFAALSVPLQGDEAIPLEQKLKQYALLQKIHTGGVVDVSAEEMTLIKTRAAKSLSLIAVGRMCEMLEEDTPGLKSVA